MSPANYMGRNEMDYADYQHGSTNDEMAQYSYQQPNQQTRYPQQQMGRGTIEDEQQNERMSPASSTSSTQDLSPYNNSKLKKRSSSTSSGLRTLGRIFGAKKNKSRDQVNKTNADAYSDSELSFNNETAAQPSQVKPTTNGWTAAANAADFDRKTRKKNELLQEVRKLKGTFSMKLN